MITKAEIARLPAEDQEALAQLELSKVRQRQQLLKEAQGGLDWRSVFLGIYIIALAGVLLSWFYYGGQTEKRYVAYALCGLVVVNSLIQIYTARINRRLDALLELLEMDQKLQNRDEGTNEKKIG